MSKGPKTLTPLTQDSGALMLGYVELTWLLGGVDGSVWRPVHGNLACHLRALLNEMLSSYRLRGSVFRCVPRGSALAWNSSVGRSQRKAPAKGGGGRRRRVRILNGSYVAVSIHWGSFFVGVLITRALFFVYMRPLICGNSHLGQYR